MDANVVAYLVLPGIDTPNAERLRASDDQWLVPGLFRHEWLNIITRHVQRKVFDRDVALRHYRRGLALVEIDASNPDVVRVLNLHMRSGCSGYDCQYVAFAEDSGATLVTLDAEILQGFPDIAVSLRTY